MIEPLKLQAKPPWENWSRSDHAPTCTSGESAHRSEHIKYIRVKLSTKLNMRMREAISFFCTFMY